MPCKWRPFYCESTTFWTRFIGELRETLSMIIWRTRKTRVRTWDVNELPSNGTVDNLRAPRAVGSEHHNRGHDPSIQNEASCRRNVKDNCGIALKSIFIFSLYFLLVQKMFKTVSFLVYFLSYLCLWFYLDSFLVKINSLPSVQVAKNQYEYDIKAVCFFLKEPRMPSFFYWNNLKHKNYFSWLTQSFGSILEMSQCCKDNLSLWDVSQRSHTWQETLQSIHETSGPRKSYDCFIRVGNGWHFPPSMTTYIWDDRK